MGRALAGGQRGRPPPGGLAGGGGAGSLVRVSRSRAMPVGDRRSSLPAPVPGGEGQWGAVTAGVDEIQDEAAFGVPVG